MRTLILAAALAVGAGGAADAAVVTYALTTTFDTRDWSISGGGQLPDGSYEAFTIERPRQTVSLPLTTTIVFDTDVISLAGKTVSADLDGTVPEGVIGGTWNDWNYSGFSMTFDAQFRVTAYAFRGIYSLREQTLSDQGSTYRVSENFFSFSYSEEKYGPRPPYDDFYGSANSIYSTAVPGTWTVDGLEPAPVPLPATAPMLVIGAAAMAGVRAVRRRA